MYSIYVSDTLNKMHKIENEKALIFKILENLHTTCNALTLCGSFLSEIAAVGLLFVLIITEASVFFKIFEHFGIRHIFLGPALHTAHLRSGIGLRWF